MKILVKLGEMHRPMAKNAEPSSLPTSQTSTSSSLQSIGSGISFFKELQFEGEFKYLKTIYTGKFSNIYLAKSASTTDFSSTSQGKIAIKAFPCSLNTVDEFNREVNLTYFLSPHPNIVKCFNVTFRWNNCYCFIEEAALGSLDLLLQKQKILPEKKVKILAMQLCSALEFMHDLNLVHGQVMPENILIFKNSLSRIKLADFSRTHINGTLVSMTKGIKSQAFFKAPEICELLPLEKFYLHPLQDVWQFGILLCICLTGRSFWKSADSLTDTSYRNYCLWLRRKNLKTPGFLKPFTPRFLRLLKRLLEPKLINRSDVSEVKKYLEDDWFKTPQKKFQIITYTETQSRARSSTASSTEFSKSITQGPNIAGSTSKSLGRVRKPLKDLGLDSPMEENRRALQDWIEMSRVKAANNNVMEPSITIAYNTGDNFDLIRS